MPPPSPSGWLPFWSRFKDYNLETLKADALAGLTVALVLMPQSMAYAQLADLPAHYGLYASLLPPVVAALFGSSRQLSTGPVAVVSLMTSAFLAPLAPAGSPGFIAYALLLSLVVGLFQLSLGLLRLGLVVNFISHPVVNGFTNAAALIIASSQLAKFLGVRVERSEHYLETIWRVGQAALSHAHWPTLAMGLLALAIMIILKKLKPASPYVLAAVVITTLLSWGLGFDHQRRIPLDQVASPQLRSQLETFQRALSQAALHHQAAARLRAQAGAHQGGPVGRLDLNHQALREDLLASLSKERAADLLPELRALVLREAPGPQGPRFHREESLPPGLRPTSEGWRLILGDRSLDLAALPLQAGGEVVGKVQAGLPSLGLPPLDWRVLPQLVPFAVIISLLGFTEAISIAKAMSAQTGQTLDPNRELIGQGLGNVAGSLSMGYPVSGSFSRSAVNLQAGARTSLSSLFTSLAVGLSLIFFTPLLYHLPQSVLAAVIMMAVAGLLNLHGMVHAFKAQAHDGVIAVITFVATLAFAPHLDRGIFLGVGLSLLVFLYKSMRPHVAELALDEHHVFRDAMGHGLEKCDRISVIRFDGPLFFANASFLESQIAQRRVAMPNLRHILLVCDGIGDLDASGEEALSLIVDRLRAAHIKISFAGVHQTILAVMKRTQLLAKIGEENLYPTVDEAISHIHQDAHRDVGTDLLCPLLAACHTGEHQDRELH